MKAAGKIPRKSPLPDAGRRSHKRRDASALNRIPPRRCAYPKCPVFFTPTRIDKKYHSAACRKAHFFEQKFVEHVVGRRRCGLTDCTICRTPKTDFGGIQTTLGWFCYECVKWIHQVADQTVQLRNNPAAELENEQES
jgi:hypothetical protein